MVPLRLYLSYTLFVVIKLWDKKSHLYSEIEKKKIHNQAHNRHCKFWFPNFVNGSSNLSYKWLISPLSLLPNPHPHTIRF